MRLRAVVIGVVSGLLLGGLIGVVRGYWLRASLQPVPLDEDRGRITRVVMQYHPDTGALVAPIFTQFLKAIGREVEVVWVVGRRTHLDDLHTRMGPSWPAGRSRSVLVNKDITTWSKDRFVAMAVPARAGVAVLCAPARTRTPNPLRRNDQEVPYRLAQDPSHHFGVSGTTIDFDGGDFLATSRHFFASPLILQKNDDRFANAVALTRYLRRKMARDITWLGGNAQHVPPHHVGMYLTVIGHTAAVGDVRLADPFARQAETVSAMRLAGGIASPAFRANLTTQLDGIARQMRALGYTVVRVPLLPSSTTRAWMSYNNGIVETRGGKTIFYMPTFGAPALDAAAAKTFRTKIGCTVVPIDCAEIWPLGGSLHCLVNVVQRSNN